MLILTYYFTFIPKRSLYLFFVGLNSWAFEHQLNLQRWNKFRTFCRAIMAHSMLYSCTYGREDGARLMPILSLRPEPVVPGLLWSRGPVSRVRSAGQAECLAPLQYQHKGIDRWPKPLCRRTPLNGVGTRGGQARLTSVGAASAASSALGQLGEAVQPISDGGGGSNGGSGKGSGGSSGGGGEGGASDAGASRQEAEHYVEQTGSCAPAEDVVLLEVSGMHCASCSGRVRRLLEAQPHVTSASVSLTTETALVRITIPALPLTVGPSGRLTCSLIGLTFTCTIV